MKLKMVKDKQVEVNQERLMWEINHRTPHLFSSAELMIDHLKPFNRVENLIHRFLEDFSPDWEREIWLILMDSRLYDKHDIKNGGLLFVPHLDNTEKPKLGLLVNLWKMKERAKKRPEFLAKYFCSMLLKFHLPKEQQLVMEVSHSDCYYHPHYPDTDHHGKEVVKATKEFCEDCKKVLASLNDKNIFNFKSFPSAKLSKTPNSRG